MRARLAGWSASWILAGALALVAFASHGCGTTPAPAAPEAQAWQTDADGRRFAVHALARRYAHRIDAAHARTTWGSVIDLAGEDDASWLYKIYEAAGAQEAEASAGDEALAAGAQVEADPEEPSAVPEDAALRFEPSSRGLPDRGQWREGFDVADLDGDGQLDLVLGPTREGVPVPQVFRGDGRGGWRAWSEARFPALPYRYGDARVGDLDGDGHPDLVLSAHLQGFIALLGDGRGGFRRAGEGLDFAAPQAAPFSSIAIQLADFDGDGHLDVLALGEGPRLAPEARTIPAARGLVLYRGLGAGRFARRDRGTGPDAPYGRALALGDFDGDGHADVAIAASEIGRTDLVQRASADGLWQPLAVDAVRANAWVSAIAAGDFDRDGRADLAVGAVRASGGVRWTSVDVLLAAPDGSWRRVPLVSAPAAPASRALATGDLDGDGALDLASVDEGGATTLWRGDGRGGFRREQRPPLPFPGGCRGTHVAIVDLDGDGRGDLVASFAEERTGGAASEHCPGEGGLAAWRTLPAER